MDKTQKTNKEFYDRSAEQWTASHTNSFWHENQFRAFVKMLPKGARVIDIGCASGIHVPLFLGIGRHLKYEGVDLSSKFLSIARARFPQLSFRRANILDAKTLPKNKYDAFWAVAVMQHIPLKDWPTMLTNMEKLVKKGGVGYFTVPTERPNPASKEDRRFFEFFDDAKLRAAITPRGWKVVKSGERAGRTGNALWRWYIVRLP